MPVWLTPIHVSSCSLAARHMNSQRGPAASLFCFLLRLACRRRKSIGRLEIRAIEGWMSHEKKKHLQERQRCPFSLSLFIFILSLITSCLTLILSIHLLFPAPLYIFSRRLQSCRLKEFCSGACFGHLSQSGCCPLRAAPGSPAACAGKTWKGGHWAAGEAPVVPRCISTLVPVPVFRPGGARNAGGHAKTEDNGVDAETCRSSTCT